ncbi:MAG: 8-oxo-dGTP diphosphatase [Gammaproteobacteria bacterium]|jgi:8-oxo-dGTP diphosphatase
MSDERLHIAVGVIFNQRKDHVLIARRPDHVHQGGLWEFPGGKCKKGEDIIMALKRELYEELNLIIDACDSLITINHNYSDQHVKLDVWSVNDWHGDISGKEGQIIEWVSLSQLSQRAFPQANKEIIKAIQSN